ncbi:hypothetical protein [Oryzihumus leptocrescens]|uniref:Lipoprotein LpqN n=1 Tax=Oryzihumus leptocrescens TaxID=297536 RepID=A0A542ZNI1_9MICO|nr:hypothetical protein [Oryzihumus leptocrescens]TQL61921.1 hypothetical protein FB474_3345 [Oryzihumus leptocrescens]
MGDSPVWQLDVDGLEGWTPVRTDLPDEALRIDLGQRIPDQDESAIPLLATLASRARQSSDDSAPLVAMWVRYDDPSEIVPAAVASLRVAGVARDTTPDSFARGLAENWPVRSSIELGRLETASGPAHHLWAIVDVTAGAAFQVQRHDVVFWLRPEKQECLLLSTSTVDLARGADLGHELAQLSVGVRGY